MESKSQSNDRVLFLFGLAGSGKSYLSRKIASEYGFFHYEADDDMPETMKEAIKNKALFSDSMRSELFKIVADKIIELQKIHPKIVVSQGLYKNKHRQYLLERIPQLELIWIRASDETLFNRIKERGDAGITQEYAKSIKINFEEPDMKVLEVLNEGSKCSPEFNTWIS